MDAKLEKLNDDEMDVFQSIGVSKKRSLSILGFNKLNNKEWTVDHLKNAPTYAQQTDDYRNMPRDYPTVDDDLFQYLYDVKFFEGCLSVILDNRPNVTRIQTSLIQNLDFCEPDNHERYLAPEGVHQDGVEVVIPAIIVRKTNVVGANSQLYLEDDLVNPIWERSLENGEGTIMTDTGSPYYHAISCIQPQEKTKRAERGYLGFDLQLFYD